MCACSSLGTIYNVCLHVSALLELLHLKVVEYEWNVVEPDLYCVVSDIIPISLQLRVFFFGLSSPLPLKFPTTLRGVRMDNYIFLEPHIYVFVLEN